MITSDDVFDRLAAANPQPDISDLVPTPSQFTEFLRNLEGEPVHTITKPPEPDKRTRRSGILVAAAAFAVVIVIGSVWLFAAREPAEPPTNVEPTTTALPSTTTRSEPPPLVSEASQAVLDAFVKTYNDGDVDGYMALMHPDLTVVASDNGGRPSPNGAFTGTTFRRDLSTYQKRIEWEVRVGTTIELADCEGDTRVTCVATYHDFLSDAILGGDTVRVELGLDNGRIVEFTETAINGSTFDQFLGSVRRWSESEHGVRLDNLDVLITDPLDWSVYGRLYLASINMPVPEMPFAPGVTPEEMRLVIESLRWLENGAKADTAEFWPEPFIEYQVVDLALDSSQVTAWARWIDAIDVDIRLVSCERRSGDETSCTITIEDFLRHAVGGPANDWETMWTFDASTGVVGGVEVFDGRHSDYLAEVEAFAEWAAQRGEPVVIEIDPVTGDFMPTEANVAAYQALIAEYVLELGG